MALIRFSRHYYTFVLLTAMWTASATAQDFTVSVVPQFDPTEINRDWRPLLTHLGKVTGHRFHLRVYATFSEFESDFTQGRPDFVYLNPYHASIAKQTQGYEPLVRSSTALTGIIVVKADSPIRTVEELNGKKVAFPAPNAFAASIYLRAMLGEKEKVTVDATFVGSHSNSYRHVLLGKAIAGGGVASTLKKESAAVQQGLRILYTSPGFVSHPIVAHPRVPASLQMQVQDTLIGLTHDATGQKLLAAIRMESPVKTTFNQDYKAISDLNLERYLPEKTQ